MVTGKSPIVPTTWVGQPSSDANEEIPMVTQLDEERQRLWEMAKANFEKAHKRYKDFADKSRREVNFEEGDEVWLNIKNFWLPERLNHKFFGPYASPFKVLEKKFLETYKLKLLENLKVHPVYHVSLSKPVAHDASKPNWEHNSRPPPDLVHNEPKFEVEVVLKSRELKGREREYLVKWKGYHSIKASWVNWSDMEHAQEAKEEFHNRPFCQFVGHDRHPNGFSLPGLLNGSPEIALMGLSQLWSLITLQVDLGSKCTLKKSCSSRQELFNRLSHALYS